LKIIIFVKKYTFYAKIAAMDNKKRNEKILQITCDFLAQINFEVEKAFVEDVESERKSSVGGSDCG
jgi:hypothetical protein